MPGLTTTDVENAIKLLTAAKQMGVNSFRLGEFVVNFENNKPDVVGVYPSDEPDEGWFDGMVGPK